MRDRSTRLQSCQSLWRLRFPWYLWPDTPTAPCHQEQDAQSHRQDIASMLATLPLKFRPPTHMGTMQP